MTTRSSFGIRESDVDPIDDCVHLLRILQEQGLLRGNTINGLPIPDELGNAAKNVRERIVDTKAFHASICSLLLLFVDAACPAKAVDVESHQLTAEEESRFERDETDGVVVRLRPEEALNDADLMHRWCPECFDSGYLTPLQEIEPFRNCPITVQYCFRCDSTHEDSPYSLVSQYQEWLTL